MRKASRHSGSMSGIVGLKLPRQEKDAAAFRCRRRPQRGWDRRRTLSVSGPAVDPCVGEPTAFASFHPELGAEPGKPTAGGVGAGIVPSRWGDDLGGRSERRREPSAQHPSAFAPGWRHRSREADRQPGSLHRGSPRGIETDPRPHRPAGIDQSQVVTPACRRFLKDPR